MFLVKPGIASFLGGVATTSFFHPPAINKSSIKLLGIGGLQATAINTATLAISFFVANKVNSSSSDETKERNAWTALFASYGITGTIMTVATKVLLNRFGFSMTYKEAFTSLAISGTASIIAAIYNDFK